MSDKKAAWDAVHAAYKGTPIVSAVPKAKTILKLPTRKPRPAPIGAEEPPVPPVGAAAEPKAAAPPPPKPKTVLKLKRKPLAPMPFKGGAQKEEIPEREQEGPVETVVSNKTIEREPQALSSFKAKHGPALPKSAKKALLIKRDELEGALMLGGMSEEKARAAASKYRYKGEYGFRIHKTPKGFSLSEEPSDFDKEMDKHEREMGKAITSAFDRMKESKPEDYKKFTDMLPSKRK
jgi:hypothetical protein